MTTFLIKSEAGSFRAYFSETGLARLEFPLGQKSPSNEMNDDTQRAGEIIRWKKLLQSALDDVLNGRAPKELPPLDVSQGTDFQRRVWQVLRSIPSGQTMSYAEVAQAIRNPKATRAVGQACGANPIPILIPCHRVLAAHKRIGGFSGGLDWKQKLLAIENVAVE